MPLEEGWFAALQVREGLTPSGDQGCVAYAKQAYLAPLYPPLLPLMEKIPTSTQDPGLKSYYCFLPKGKR